MDKREERKAFDAIFDKCGLTVEEGEQPISSVEPRSISFKGAVQTLEAFQPALSLLGEHDLELRRSLYGRLLEAVAGHRGGGPPQPL